MTPTQIRVWCRTEPELAALAAMLLVTVAAVVAVIALAVNADREWAAWCADQGGRVETSTHPTTGVGINPANGQPVITSGSSSTSFCVTRDGRILGVR